MTVSVQHAQADLLGLIRQLAAGEELVLTDNDVPVATVTPTATGLRPPPGLWKGKVVILAEDDEHLKAFEEHTA